MDNISEKIRKLLALAKSSNEHEAAAAAELASSLALKHNIDLIKLQTSPSDYKENTVYDSTKSERWISNIISGLCLVSACKHFTWVQLDGSINYRVVGRSAAVTTVNQLTTYLLDAVKRLNREYVKQHEFNQQERADYRKAFRLAASQRLYKRFKDRFDELNKKDDTLYTGSTALVVSSYFDSERQNIEDFLKNHGLQEKTSRAISLKSSIGYHDGAKAGETINLGDQIHGVRNCRQIR